MSDTHCLDRRQTGDESSASRPGHPLALGTLHTGVSAGEKAAGVNPGDCAWGKISI